MKNPPFTITNYIISLVSDIAEKVGKITTTEQLERNPTLRRKNRIRTIYGSLCIEQNTLTLEQVTAILNGKHILAPIKDITEVKNAYEIYENMDLLNPYSEEDLLKSHGVMMRNLVEEAGEYRSRPVGVVDSESGEVIHFGTLPDYVPRLMSELLRWGEESDTHPLIKSCVFHYEFELIHPFLDGNGRIGRLWHTLILSKWNPIFAWLPIESMIEQRQKEYYQAINECNAVGESTKFIVFMLETICSVLDEVLTCSDAAISEHDKEQVEEHDITEELLEFCKIPRSRAEMQEFCGIGGRKKFYTMYLAPMLKSGKLEMTIPEKPKSKLQKYKAREVSNS